MDTALLYIDISTISHKFATYSWKSEECYQCPMVQKCVLNETLTTTLVDTNYKSTVAITGDGRWLLCQKSYHFNEDGQYLLTVNSNSQCNLQIIEEGIYSYWPLIWITFMCLLGFFLYGFCHKFFKGGSVSEEDKQKVDRLRSLDTFRGISVVFMIFVNYGGGGYWLFKHSIWNGITVADLMFPWFMFIMGTSMAISFEKSLISEQTNKNRLSSIICIIRRCIMLFLLGIFIVNDPASWDKLIIMGVLQRFAVCYLVVATIRTYSVIPTHMVKRIQIKKSILIKTEFVSNYLPEVVCYWKEWLFYFGVTMLWLSVTYLLPLPNCSTGYLGSGGISNNYNQVNCTGGAAGYIDWILLGANHMDRDWLSDKYLAGMYLIPFDYSGVLCSLMSIVITFLGLQAGQILLVYNNFESKAVRLIFWALIYGALAGLLCGFSKNEGFMPLNRHTWSLSFVLAVSAYANIFIVILHYVVDVKHLWSGAPFYFAGMNSLVLFVLHWVFRDWLFVGGWEKVDTHKEHMIANIWGTTVWTLFAYYLHCKKFYFIL